MSVQSQTYNTVPGTSQVYDPSLTGVLVRIVCREGVEHDRTVGTPGNRQFVYIGGRITFEQVFLTGEKIWVLYEAA